VSELEDIQILARGTGIAVPGQILGRVLTFVGLVALARLLGPAAFGLYAIGWTVLRTGTLVAAMGLPAGVVRLGSLERGRNPAGFRGVVLQSLGSALALGTLLGIALYLLAPWLATRLFNDPGLTLVLRLFAPCLALAAGLQVAASATRVTRRVQFSIFATEVLQPGLYVVLSVSLLLLGAGLPEVILAAVLSYAVAFVAAVWMLFRLFPELRQVGSGVESVLGRLFRLSIPISLAVTFATVIFWVDRLIIGIFEPAAEVGVYQAASQAASLFAVILGSVSVVFGPMVAHLSTETDRGRMLELFRVSTKWTLYVSLPVLMVVWFAPRGVLNVLYGPAYVPGATALILLTVGQTINAGTGPTGPFLNMTGHHLVWLRLSGLALLTNVILCLLLVPRWGMEGAAASTGLSLTVLSLTSLAVVRRILGAWPYDRRFLKLGAAVLAMAVYLALVEAFAPLAGWAHIFLMAAGALIVFIAVTLALGLDEEDRAFLAIFRRRVAGLVSPGRPLAPAGPPETDDSAKDRL
jgi:O-antigen/teichoic acid export membrane protein